jgi:HK97 family phage prohead protease
MTKETRNFDMSELRVESGGEKEPSKIIGYAAKFNRYSQPITDWRGTYKEVIKPGAFSKVLDNDTRALFNHNSDYVLGRSKSGTLKIIEDDIGLRMEATPPNTTWARDLMESVERGDVDQMSFAFAPDDEDFYERDGALIREHRSFGALADVSVVTYPAYEDTEAQVRSLDALSDVLNIEKLTPIIARHKRSLPLGESEIQVVQKTVSYLQDIAGGVQESASAPAEPGVQERSNDSRWEQIKKLEGEI